MLIETPHNPIPEGAIAGEIKTPDGVRLRFACWPPAGEKRKGTVCLFQGRAEFIEKYFETVNDLRARGFAVATLDWRGQGGSARLLKNPSKGHVRDFRDYLVDLKTFMEQIVMPDCPPPYYVLAHSMGALALFMAEPQFGNWFERMVFTGPLFGLGELYEPVRLTRFAVQTLAALGLKKFYPPGMGDTLIGSEPFEGNPLSSDEARFRRNEDVIKAAPWLALGAPTIGWSHAAFAAMDAVTEPAFGARVKVPILIVAAGGDRIVSNIAIEQVAVHLRAGSRIVLAGARHEILQERSVFREQFLAAFDAFIPGSSTF